MTPFGSRAGSGPSGRFGASLAAETQELGQPRYDLVEITDDGDVAEPEDRRGRILVDRDDRRRALHPHLVLDRAGDATGEVELRLHRLAALADKAVPGIPP